MSKSHSDYKAEDVLYELPAQRGISEKHFQMADGSKLAVAYAYPVHYQTENGFENIDNTLKLDEGGRVYRNAAGLADIRLAVESGEGVLAKICFGKDSVSITPMSETRSTARVSVCENMTAEGSLESVILPQTNNSTALYEDIFPHTDLAYTVEEVELKENIIIKERAEKYSFPFMLDPHGLEAVKEENGSISLLTAEGECRFVIFPPFMRDASGAISREVSFVLEKADSAYSLRVEAESKWIDSEERQFPVTVDPPISLTDYNNVEVGTIYEFLPNGCSGEVDVSYIGYQSFHPDAPRMRMLMRVNQLPDLPSNSRIIYGCVGLYQTSYTHWGMSSFHIQTNPLTSNWATSGYWCLYHTWNNCPPLAANATDYVTVSEAPGFHSVGITNDAIGWYADPDSNYGMCFLAHEEDSMGAYYNAYAVFLTSKYDNGTGRPYFAVNYRSNVGRVDYYSYRTHSIDRAGTGYIGDNNGQLTVVKADCSFASDPSPVSIEHIYNSAYGSGQLSSVAAAAGYSSMYAGKGWKLNIQQQVSAFGSGSLQYMDADGTVHYFYLSESGGNVYEDEDGLNLTITASGGNYTMTDRKGNIRYFASGLLRYTQDANGNRITYGYSGGRITTITRKNTDGTDEALATLAYSGNYLSTITDAADRVTSYTYSGGNLTQVTHPDGTTVTYTYTSNRLTKAMDDESQYAVAYTYNSSGRVSKYAEYGGGTLGLAVKASGTVGLRQYRSSGLGRTLEDADDLLTTCVFDSFGRTVTEYTTNYNKTLIYGASAARYTANSGTSGTNNRLSIAGAIGMRDVGSTAPYECQFENLLTNGEMNGTSGWSGGGSSVTDSTFGHALRVTGAIGSAKSLAQTVTVNTSGKQTYIFTGWAKAHSVPLSESNRRFELRAVLTYTDDTTETQSSSFCADTAEWQYNVLPIVPKKPAKTVRTIKVSLHYADNLNDVYFTYACLTREVAQSYKYNSDGDLISVTSPGSSTESFSYSGADLISQVAKSGVSYEYEYDDKHNVTAVTSDTLRMDVTNDTRGNTTATELGATGTAKKIRSAATYGGRGNLVVSQSDARGMVTSYVYGTPFYTALGKPKTIKNAKNITTTYLYDEQNGRASSTYLGSIVSLAYSYADGRLSQIERTGGTNSQSYDLTYNVFGNLKTVKVGGTRTLVSKTYAAHNGPLATLTYGNGQSFSYVYDDLERLTGVRYNGSTSNALTYTYWGEGQVKRLTDTPNNRRYDYSYDNLGRLQSATEKQGSTEVVGFENTYDPADRLISRTYRFRPAWSGTQIASREYTWQYSTTDGSLVKYTYPSAVDGCHITYGYDALKRLSTRNLNVNGGLCAKRGYTYVAGSGTNGTTLLVSKVTNKNGSDEVLTEYTYTYDNVGNILTVGGSSTESYTYDAQDRLTKAVINGTTYTYSYDGSGNLTSKSNGVTTDTYAYTNTAWRDLLKEYNNGTTIMYDTSGNPTTWYDGATMTWVNGRRLASISATSAHGAASFTYDASGLRLTKTVGGVIHRYVWENGRLVSDAWSDKYIEFIYDEQGVPLVMVYKSDAQTAATKYLYVTNPQGDVTGITTVGGTSKASYTYDPYGKVLSATGALASVNPLRYRGYYYDAELGLYYLKSRYYDPEICRFINADDPSMLGANGGFVSYNLFAYCGCNPVNNIDIDGKKVAGLGFTVSGGFGVGGSSGFMMISDDEGNEATILTGYYGGGTPTISASINVLFSSADNIFDYVATQTVGGGGSIGLVGLDVSYGYDQKGKHYSSLSVSAGLSVIPAEGHAGIGYARFIEITKYHGKTVPSNVDMSFFADLPQAHQDMLRRQLFIPDAQGIPVFSPVSLMETLSSNAYSPSAWLKPLSFS